MRMIPTLALAVILMVMSLSCTDGEKARQADLPAGTADDEWPVLKRYSGEYLEKVAMPLGGIGTGTVSLGGRGDLRDWEIMNRAAKGYIPVRGNTGPFFVLFAKAGEHEAVTRALEGPLDVTAFEGSHGSALPNHGLPRFSTCSFAAAYPLGQVSLSDPAVPLRVRIKAFNPLVPADTEASGMPAVSLTFELRNTSPDTVEASIAGNMPNFIGNDGSVSEKNWTGDIVFVGGKQNHNSFRAGLGVKGIFMESGGVDPKAEAWGTMALVTPDSGTVSYRTSWEPERWGSSLLDYWDDFNADGVLEERDATGEDTPMSSLAVKTIIPPGETREVSFCLAWRFPNRRTWTPKGTDDDIIGNYYATVYADAWDAAERFVSERDSLEQRTVEFVRAFCESELPDVVKEAALFNVSTLRTQTCFRTSDGRFYGWEGSCNTRGCCHGSCTHVWNYEQATAFLFGDLAKSMREVEFGHATDDAGVMSFRVHLPLPRAQEWGKAAADGQLGCIMKMYRDWQLSGDDAMLRALWPNVRKAVEFCWIEGGWDANKDGVMEGCQHNTMDVEYYGPNPQMGIWYLGALRAASAMASSVGDTEFAATCTQLCENGSAWIDANLFNGEYYEHKVMPPARSEDVAPSLLVGMGASDITNPDYQLANGCLVDQLVGQYMAHICGLGYLTEQAKVRTTLQSIMKYNLRNGFADHFNCMRSFVMGDESALLMASYPNGRPENPFPYFPEVMTGFEYTAAVGMLYEGQTAAGLRCIDNIRARYDGRKRSPFDEAECGHHYARAMASWAAVLALTGFHWSGVDHAMEMLPGDGTFFWSNGYAWGNCLIGRAKDSYDVSLTVLGGTLDIRSFTLKDFGRADITRDSPMATGDTATVTITKG